MQALNYTPRAIEHLLSIQLPLLRQGMRKTSSALSHVLFMLERAPKFLLPNMGQQVTLEPTLDGYGDTVQIASGEVVLEYAYEPEHLRLLKMLDQQPATKRIALAWAHDSDAGRMLTDPAGGKSLGPGTFVLPIFSATDPDDGSEGWAFPAGLGFLPRGLVVQPGMAPESSSDELLLRANRESGAILVSNLGMQARVLNAFPEMTEAALAAHGGDEDVMAAALMGDLSDEMWSVIQFCVLLGRPGTKAVEIKAPEKLNKKRASQGRPPLPSYLVLKPEDPAG